MVFRVAVVVNPEAASDAVQEHTGKRRRQTRMFTFTEGQGRREIHESARGCLHVEKHLRAVRLVFALAPFMWVRGKSHGKFEGLVDLEFSVAPYEAIKRAPEELRGFLGACFPVGWLRDSEFDPNRGKRSGARGAAD